MRRHLVPGVLRPPRVPVLKVRCEIDLEPVIFELYELEVTAPREDFELEVARTSQVAKSGDGGGGGPRARAVPPLRPRPDSGAAIIGSAPTPPQERGPPAPDKLASRCRQ